MNDYMYYIFLLNFRQKISAGRILWFYIYDWFDQLDVEALVLAVCCVSAVGLFWLVVAFAYAAVLLLYYFAERLYVKIRLSVHLEHLFVVFINE